MLFSFLHPISADCRTFTSRGINQVRHWNCEEDVLARYATAGTFIGKNQWIPRKKTMGVLQKLGFGDGSKPCAPGEHQNSW